MKGLLLKSGLKSFDFREVLSGKVPNEMRIWFQNKELVRRISETAALCTPSEIRLCDGSIEEYESLCRDLVSKGVFIPLNPERRPGSYLCRSDPADVARVEEATFICSKNKEDAGPTNNWQDPAEMNKTLDRLFAGCMKGRILYVIPFCMGPLASPFSIIGVQITDSPYVVCSMKIMTNMGTAALEKLGPEGRFIPCIHSVGKPLQEGEKDVPWPSNAIQKYIVHFPEERKVRSFGSGYGGNALLGKKSVALRIASVIGKEEGWLAEHMLIIGVTNPEGRKKYIAAAFPSQCGKTNLALLSSKLPGWKVECVGDDIAWIRPGKDGRLHALNPEAGFFGVAPGTSYASNPYAMETIAKNTIFTNVALTGDKDVWWEGMTKEIPSPLIDWTGDLYNPASGKPAAQSNARFTVSKMQCPILDPASNDPRGVPLSAILFGGRRSSTIPLVYQSCSWEEGVFLGASVSSETTAAATGVVGKVRHDPFAMLPFCGYNMGDYFAHWLEIGKRIKNPPPVFYVNWFRKNAEGRFIWPGFGDNIRVLKWIFEREEGVSNYTETSIGLVPSKDALDLSGIATEVDVNALFSISSEDWKKEEKEIESYFALFGKKLPEALANRLEELKLRLAKS